MEIASNVEIVELQAGFLRKKVDKLGLTGIDVDANTQIIAASDFRKIPSLGYTSLDELSIAIIASNGSKRFSAPSFAVTCMLILPTLEGSGLLFSDSTRRLYADQFWVCENGMFQPTFPTEPIPIDGLDVSFDHFRKDPELEPYYKHHNELFKITGDKNKTRQILAKAGVRIPSGILLEASQDTGEQIVTFLEQNPTARGLVLKALHGAQGKQVKLYDIKDVNSLLEHFKISRLEQAVVEERIIPPTAPERLLSLARYYGIEKPDYNFRVITSLDREDPKVVTAEIRLQEAGNKPVNISLGAKAARLNSLESTEAIRGIYSEAKDAVRAVCQEVLAPGEHMLGIAGVDVIQDEVDGKYKIMEVNTGFVGGFGTLCRFDGQPLSKIRDSLIPAYAPFLEAGFADRSDGLPNDLRRLPFSAEDLNNFFNFYTANNRYHQARQFLEDFEQSFNDPIAVANGLIFTGHRIAQQQALEYIDKALEHNPGNFQLRLYKNQIRRELARD